MKHDVLAWTLILFRFCQIHINKKSNQALLVDPPQSETAIQHPQVYTLQHVEKSPESVQCEHAGSPNIEVLWLWCVTLCFITVAPIDQNCTNDLHSLPWPTITHPALQSPYSVIAHIGISPCSQAPAEARLFLGSPGRVETQDSGPITRRTNNYFDSSLAAALA